MKHNFLIAESPSPSNDDEYKLFNGPLLGAVRSYRKYIEDARADLEFYPQQEDEGGGFKVTKTVDAVEVILLAATRFLSDRTKGYDNSDIQHASDVTWFITKAFVLKSLNDDGIDTTVEVKSINQRVCCIDVTVTWGEDVPYETAISHMKDFRKVWTHGVGRGATDFAEWCKISVNPVNCRGVKYSITFLSGSVSEVEDGLEFSDIEATFNIAVGARANFDTATTTYFGHDVNTNSFIYGGREYMLTIMRGDMSNGKYIRFVAGIDLEYLYKLPSQSIGVAV